MTVPTCPAHPDATLRPAGVHALDRFWGRDDQTRFTYNRCPDCGTWILDPRPESADMGRYYGGYYPEEELTFRRMAWKRWKPLRALGVDGARALDIKLRLKRLGFHWGPEVKVLDAGSGVGGFLAGLRADTGVQVQGVDFNPACRTFAAEVYGVDVLTGELAAQALPDGAFDVVTSWHCLEHTFDPVAELKELRRLTRPGGFAVIEVPSAGLLARIFRGRWFFLQAPTHLFHFRPTALKTLLEQGGWLIRQVRRPWLPSELAGSLMLALGVRRFVPSVMYGKGVANNLARIGFGLLMVIDTPITFLLALAGTTGVLRVVAQRPMGSDPT